MRPVLISIVIIGIFVSCNPFAPGLDESGNNSSLLSDAKTTEGVFQNIKYAYTMRDTSVYGQLINSNFTFSYIDYDAGTSPTWGRDEEMRATHGLFQNAQRLSLVWNNIQSSSVDSTNTNTQIKRGYTLDVTFNPNDFVTIYGYATLQMTRPRSEDPWTIIRWNDESNY